MDEEIVMPKHSLDRGDLVTQKGTSWTFTLDGDPSLPPDATVSWSYGTRFTSDTIADAVLPTVWQRAGDRWESEAITFPLAAPYAVRVVVRARLPIIGLRFGSPIVGLGGVEQVDPDGPPSQGGARPTGSGDVVVPAVPTRPTTVPRPLPPVGGIGTTPPEPLGGGDQSEFTEIVLEDTTIFVFPGLLLPREGPAFLAVRTEGHLPLLFEVLGMGNKVEIAPRVGYTIRASIGAVGEQTKLFTRASDPNSADSPTREQENGGGSAYIVYISPSTIGELGLAGNAAALPAPIPIDLELSARPAPDPDQPSSPQPARLVAVFTGVKQYIDARPGLIHMSRSDEPFRRFSMANDAAQEGAARTFIEKRLKFGGTKTKTGTVPVTITYPYTNRFGTVYTQPSDLEADEGELIEATNSSKGDRVSIGVRIRDTQGVAPAFLLGYNYARVEAEMRGAAVFVYYALERGKRIKVLGDLPRCLIGPQEGSMTMTVCRSAPQANVLISGLDDEGLSFDYAGVAAGFLGLAQGAAGAIAATAGGSTAVFGASALATPYVTLPLVLAVAAANVIWATTFPTQPYTSGEASIVSSLSLHTWDGAARSVEGQPLAGKVSPPRTSNTAGGATVDATFTVRDSVDVGDLVRVAQLFAVGTSQEANESNDTTVVLDHHGYERALEMRVTKG